MTLGPTHKGRCRFSICDVWSSEKCGKLQRFSKWGDMKWLEGNDFIENLCQTKSERNGVKVQFKLLPHFEKLLLQYLWNLRVLKKSRIWPYWDQFIWHCLHSHMNGMNKATCTGKWPTNMLGRPRSTRPERSMFGSAFPATRTKGKTCLVTATWDALAFSSTWNVPNHTENGNLIAFSKCYRFKWKEMYKLQWESNNVTSAMKRLVKYFHVCTDKTKIGLEYEQRLDKATCPLCCSAGNLADAALGAFSTNHN